MNELMEKTIQRHALAKQAVMRYPHYTDETRKAWLDSIDGSLDTIYNAHKMCREILEDCFKKKD
jgi:hypothetical protein